MEQRIIDALIEKLHELFPEIKAYDVKMDRDVEPPMFGIDCYATRIIDRILPGGFFYACDFEILFFPGNDEPEEEIRRVQLKLMNALWLFGNGYRADNRNAKTINGVLHVFFSVTTAIKPVLEKPPVIEEIQSKVFKDGNEIYTGTIKKQS